MYVLQVEIVRLSTSCLANMTRNKSRDLRRVEWSLFQPKLVGSPSS